MAKALFEKQCLWITLLHIPVCICGMDRGISILPWKQSLNWSWKPSLKKLAHHKADIIIYRLFYLRFFWTGYEIIWHVIMYLNILNILKEYYWAGTLQLGSSPYHEQTKYLYISSTIYKYRFIVLMLNHICFRSQTKM